MNYPRPFDCVKWTGFVKYQQRDIVKYLNPDLHSERLAATLMFILLRWGLSDYTLITFSKIKSRLCLSSLILMGSFGLTGVRVPGGARWLGPRKGFYFFAVRATKP